MSIFIQVPAHAERWHEAVAQALPSHPRVDDPTLARYALVWRHPAGLFGQMPELEAVFVLGAGVERVLADPSLAPELPVFRLRDAGMATQMADYVSCAALHFQRDFDTYRRDQRAARWQPLAPRPRLRVGLLGFGALGQVVADRLVALGFPVRAWARSSREHGGVEVLAGPAGLDALLSRSDLLVSMLPETAATIGLLDRVRLASLPAGAAIVNAGRGSLIDEGALVELLDAGHLRGAFLDVVQTEPLRPEHPLWRHPKISLTPHIAAATLVEPAVAQVAATIDALERGAPLPPTVDRAQGY